MSASLAVQRLAALSGALAVTAGAYGAHGFRLSNRDEYQREAGAILLTGMGCFCGPLYHQALTGDPSFGKLAPIGGVLFIVGWLAMAI